MEKELTMVSERVGYDEDNDWFFLDKDGKREGPYDSLGECEEAMLKAGE